MAEIQSQRCSIQGSNASQVEQSWLESFSPLGLASFSPAPQPPQLLPVENHARLVSHIGPAAASSSSGISVPPGMAYEPRQHSFTFSSLRTNMLNPALGCDLPQDDSDRILQRDMPAHPLLGDASKSNDKAENYTCGKCGNLMPNNSGHNFCVHCGIVRPSVSVPVPASVLAPAPAPVSATTALAFASRPIFIAPPRADGLEAVSSSTWSKDKAASFSYYDKLCKSLGPDNVFFRDYLYLLDASNGETLEDQICKDHLRQLGCQKANEGSYHNIRAKVLRHIGRHNADLRWQFLEKHLGAKIINNDELSFRTETCNLENCTRTFCRYAHHPSQLRDFGPLNKMELMIYNGYKKEAAEMSAQKRAGKSLYNLNTPSQQQLPDFAAELHKKQVAEMLELLDKSIPIMEKLIEESEQQKHMATPEISLLEQETNILERLKEEMSKVEQDIAEKRQALSRRETLVKGKGKASDNPEDNLFENENKTLQQQIAKLEEHLSGLQQQYQEAQEKQDMVQQEEQQIGTKPVVLPLVRAEHTITIDAECFSQTGKAFSTEEAQAFSKLVASADSTCADISAAARLNKVLNVISSFATMLQIINGASQSVISSATVNICMRLAFKHDGNSEFAAKLFQCIYMDNLERIFPSGQHNFGYGMFYLSVAKFNSDEVKKKLYVELIDPSFKMLLEKTQRDSVALDARVVQAFIEAYSQCCQKNNSREENEKAVVFFEHLFPLIAKDDKSIVYVTNAFLSFLDSCEMYKKAREHMLKALKIHTPSAPQVDACTFSFMLRSRCCTDNLGDYLGCFERAKKENCVDCQIYDGVLKTINSTKNYEKALELFVERLLLYGFDKIYPRFIEELLLNALIEEKDLSELRLIHDLSLAEGIKLIGRRIRETFSDISSADPEKEFKIKFLAIYKKIAAIAPDSEHNRKLKDEAEKVVIAIEQAEHSPIASLCFAGPQSTMPIANSSSNSNPQRGLSKRRSRESYAKNAAI